MEHSQQRASTLPARCQPHKPASQQDGCSPGGPCISGGIAPGGAVGTMPGAPGMAGGMPIGGMPGIMGGGIPGGR